MGRECWTAVGTRTPCAIKLAGDPMHWTGPPYSVAETVFDAADFPALYASVAERDAELLLGMKRRAPGA